MRYAVFDWDNTIREGYTLFSWIEYLCNNKILPNSLNQKEQNLGERYNRHEITHDKYADIACCYYAKELAGMRVELLENKVSRYMPFDETNLFPFVRDVFMYLSSHNIKPIVISGAPERIIKRYVDEFNLYEIYAVKEQEEGALFNGNLEYNYGYEKHKIMRRLLAKYGRPEFGFGDSSSDIPLLTSAIHGVCVYDEIPMISVNNMIKIRKDENGSSAVNKLRRAAISKKEIKRTHKILKNSAIVRKSFG